MHAHPNVHADESHACFQHVAMVIIADWEIKVRLQVLLLSPWRRCFGSLEGLAKFMPSAPCVLRLCGTNGCTRTASPQIDLRHNFKQVPQNCPWNWASHELDVACRPGMAPIWPNHKRLCLGEMWAQVELEKNARMRLKLEDFSTYQIVPQCTLALFWGLSDHPSQFRSPLLNCIKMSRM